MSKAERRAEQEKQRAAKVAGQTDGGTGGGKGGGQQQKKAPQQNAQAADSNVPRTPQVQHSGRGAAPDPSSVPTEKRANEPAGPPPVPTHSRLFPHLRLPKANILASASVAGTSKAEIHTSILRLALQFSSFKVTGGNARCIATLTALKSVINSYTTPQGTTLSRHLMTYLSPQISHLVAARPMSASMGNAIRWLKYEVSVLSIDLPEQNAKDYLCERIDTYIRDRITVADRVIEDHAMEKIRDGDVVLTYARSSSVEKVLKAAHEAKIKFSVVAVDCGPLFEGKSLVAALPPDLSVTYVLLPSLSPVLPTVSLCLFGAHSLLANGGLYSRAGTASVAMMARERNIPVLVCCETYKFSEKVWGDGVTHNELGEHSARPLPCVPLIPIAAPSTSALAPVPTVSLEHINLLYDLTPASYITAVVTEVGLIPPSSVPTVLFRQGVTAAQGL
ncbi:IF-2B-domain-containing protein [Calocera viscosa TUFC12733]|uniref:Translation initiation factor eIF2B subunit delta n=1 Tax=Calocera viscosa (strain TUFC12733) TaxID=1330018 RepID=A0A167KN27_CALVF|nr:IF-2B-domain-containing protein [Calocera viscosa TUFC12733]